ncbi:MAG: hypothetical protein K2I10_01505 [Lachnospiraceae bacterium]|nr:hypothetical protein [Lachnospiraceae bacterium]
MGLSEKDKNEWEKVLREGDLMKEGDSIVESVKGDYYYLGQNRGTYFFTNEAVIFVSGFGGTSAVLPYKNIKEIKKCFVGPFIPTGIKVTVFDEEKGKEKKHKLSLLSRQQWMDYLSNKSGVAL